MITLPGFSRWISRIDVPCGEMAAIARGIIGDLRLKKILDEGNAALAAGGGHVNLDDVWWGMGYDYKKNAMKAMKTTLKFRSGVFRCGCMG